MEYLAKTQLGAIALGVMCQSVSCSPGTSPADRTVRTLQVAETTHGGKGASDHSAQGGEGAPDARDATVPTMPTTPSTPLDAAAGVEDAAASDAAADARASDSAAEGPPAELADEDAGVVDPITLRRHPPDSNIHFDWEETLPGRKLCEPGHYVGTFMCDIVLSNGFVAHIKGPVELTLAKSQNGEFLELSDAHIEGFALFVFNFRAELAGRLECATRRLDAMAARGSVGLGDADLLPVLGFEGQLHGALDETGDVLSGEWSFPVSTSTEELGVCTGPWTATRMVP